MNDSQIINNSLNLPNFISYISIGISVISILINILILASFFYKKIYKSYSNLILLIITVNSIVYDITEIFHLLKIIFDFNISIYKYRGFISANCSYHILCLLLLIKHRYNFVKYPLKTTDNYTRLHIIILIMTFISILFIMSIVWIILGNHSKIIFCSVYLVYFWLVGFGMTLCLFYCIQTIRELIKLSKNNDLNFSKPKFSRKNLKKERKAIRFVFIWITSTFIIYSYVSFIGSILNFISMDYIQISNYLYNLYPFIDSIILLKFNDNVKRAFKETFLKIKSPT